MTDLTTDKNFRELCILLWFLSSSKEDCKKYKIEKENLKDYFFSSIKKYFLDLNT